MLGDPNFWTEESNSTLVWRTLDGFPEEQISDAIARTRHWVHLLPGAQQVDVESVRAAELPDSVVLQQLIEDATAIFHAKDNPELEEHTAKRRQLHIDTLKVICGGVSGYHESLSSLVAFLLMMLPPEGTISIVLALHSSARHNRDYFKKHSESFSGDAKLLHTLVQEQLPAVGAHLTKLGVLPEEFATRWFIRIGVNLLPLRELMDYFEAYFQYGYEFVVTFGLEFLREFESELLAESDAADVYAILRMEDRYREWKFPGQLQWGLSERFASAIARAMASIGSSSLGGEIQFEGMRRQDFKGDMEGKRSSDASYLNIPIPDSDDDSDGL